MKTTYKKGMLRVVFIALFGTNIIASAQPKPTPLTNANIVKLVKGGLDNELVLTKIESSTCKFDLSDDGLLALKKSGVPTAVIKAMISKMEEVKAAKPDIPTSAPPTPKPAPASSGPEPEMLNTIYLYDKSTQGLKVLETVKVNAVSRLKVVTAQAVFEMEGDKSPIRIPAGENISFLVSMSEASGEPSAWFSLYKSEKGKKRNAVWAKTNAVTGKTGTGENAMKYSVKKSGKAFEIIIPKLDKGEYFFVAMGTSMKYGGQSYDAFAFGVD